MEAFQGLNIDSLKFAVPSKGVATINGKIALGQLVILKGPSGCGKSTLLKTLAGFLPAQSGSVFLNGESQLELMALERRLGYVFQESSLFAHLTVLENILLPLKNFVPFSDWSQGLRVQRVKEFLKALSLSDLEKKSVAQLSGGEKQRVALIRALVYQPKVLFLDEPVSSLDVETAQEVLLWMRDILKDLQIPVLCVSHGNLEENIFQSKVVLWDIQNNSCQF